MLNANSNLGVSGGALRFNVTPASTGTVVVGSGVVATVASGATLELAGSVSALSAGANRGNVVNNSQAASGGLLVTGTSQQVGKIDGTGNVVVNAGASLTANHIVQNSLVIGGSAGSTATFAIVASDASGNPLVASPGLTLADSLSQSESFGTDAMSPASLIAPADISLAPANSSATASLDEGNWANGAYCSSRTLGIVVARLRHSGAAGSGDPSATPRPNRHATA